MSSVGTTANHTTRAGIKWQFSQVNDDEVEVWRDDKHRFADDYFVYITTVKNDLEAENFAEEHDEMAGRRP